MELKEYQKNLLLLFMIIILFILGFEIFLRLIADTPVVFSDIKIPDKELLSVNKKSISQIEKTKEYFTNVTINRCGLRDDDINSCYFEKNNSYKILVLGDSFTFGMGVNNNETYPYYLEQLLNNSEVLNAGVIAYGTAQEELHLEKLLAEINPDLVILGFYINDISEIGKLSKIVPPQTEQIENHIFSNLKGLLKKNVCIYKFLTDTISEIPVLRIWLTKKGIVSYSVAEIYFIYADNPPEYFQDYKKEAKNLILEMANLSNDFLLVYLPEESNFNKKMWEEIEYYNLNFINSTSNMNTPINFLREITNKGKIDFLDLTEVFAEEYDSGLYLKQDGHFSVKGHSLVATEINKFLESR